MAYTFVAGELGGGGDPDPPEVALTVQGMRASYQPGETVTLTAVQSPRTELDQLPRRYDRPCHRWLSPLQQE